MNQMLSLLKEGESGYVTALESDAVMRSRLQDIGVVEGTEITCLHRSPAGDPAAYRIRGAVVALRDTDAGKILVC